jgi:hypothetical protein
MAALGDGVAQAVHSHELAHRDIIIVIIIALHQTALG